nr:hypothetical protein [Microbacterium sp. SLBN-146]
MLVFVSGPEMAEIVAVAAVVPVAVIVVLICPAELVTPVLGLKLSEPGVSLVNDTV